MTAEILQFEPSKLEHQAQRLAKAIQSGALVALPTETVYGIAAAPTSTFAIERLSRLKDRTPESPFSLVVPDIGAARQLAIPWKPKVEKLFRRVCPGPITFVLPLQPGALDAFPPIATQACAPKGSVGIRIPDHPLTLEILQIIGVPLLLTSANHHGVPDPLDGKQVINDLKNDVDIIVDDGLTRWKQSSTVVKFDGNTPTILRAGALSPAQIRRISSTIVLFVCSGNTCRSPIAETLFRNEMAEQLKCSPDRLEEKGWFVLSCGLSAISGMPASDYAKAVMKQKGLDLSSHAAQSVSETLIRYADYIFTLCESHRKALVAAFPQAAERIRLLNPENVDILDPYGGTMEFYQTCARQIENAVHQRVITLLSKEKGSSSKKGK